MCVHDLINVELRPRWDERDDDHIPGEIHCTECGHSEPFDWFIGAGAFYSGVTNHNFTPFTREKTLGGYGDPEYDAPVYLHRVDLEEYIDEEMAEMWVERQTGLKSATEDRRYDEAKEEGRI